MSKLDELLERNGIRESYDGTFWTVMDETVEGNPKQQIKDLIDQMIGETPNYQGDGGDSLEDLRKRVEAL